MSIAHLLHRIAADVSRLGHTARYDASDDTLWIDGLGMKVHIVEPYLANRVIEKICGPRSGNEATGAIHMVGTQDPRTSACGHWWWKRGGEPARVLRDVTCTHCKYTREYRSMGLDMDRPLTVEPKR